MTVTSWCVYDLDTDTVVGEWNKYEDAEQFWADALHCKLEPNWGLFPTEECSFEVNV